MDKRLLESFDDEFDISLDEGIFDNLRDKIKQIKSGDTKSNAEYRDRVQRKIAKSQQDYQNNDAIENNKRENARQRASVNQRIGKQDATVLMRFFTTYFQNHFKELLFTEVDEEPEYEDSAVTSLQNNIVKESVKCTLTYPTKREAEIRNRILNKDLESELKKFCDQYVGVKSGDYDVKTQIDPSSGKDGTTCNVVIEAELERHQDLASTQLGSERINGQRQEQDRNNTPWETEQVDKYEGTIVEDGKSIQFNALLIKHPGTGSKTVYTIEDNTATQKYKTFEEKSDREAHEYFQNWCDVRTRKPIEKSEPSGEFVLVKIFNYAPDEKLAFSIQDKNNSYFSNPLDVDDESSAKALFNRWQEMSIEFPIINAGTDMSDSTVEMLRNCKYKLCKPAGRDDYCIVMNRANNEPHIVKTKDGQEKPVVFNKPFPQALKEYEVWVIQTYRQKDKVKNKKRGKK